MKDRNDKQRVLEYDERGNVVRRPIPPGKVVLRTFDARNNRLTETACRTNPGTPDARRPRVTSTTPTDNLTR